MEEQILIKTGLTANESKLYLLLLEMEEALASESAPGDDQALKELIEKVIRIYRRGDPDKRAHLKGFLMGADPGD